VALGDPEGKALVQALGGGDTKPVPMVKPVVWLTPKRTETLSTDAD
jgi:hypothetical protein